MHSAFATWQDFWAMGGYAFYVWLAVAVTVVPLLMLIFYTRWQRQALLREVGRQQARERRIRAARDRQSAKVAP